MIRKRFAHLLAAALYVATAAGLPRPALAVPDWKTQRTVGSLILYADDARPSRWYYAPGEIQVATLEDGRPDFRFLETRYTGSAVVRDQGVIRHKSLVTFRVRLARPTAADLAAATRELGAGEIRPFPIRRLETALVYASVGSADTTALPAGRFESSEEGGSSAAASYWTERVYTMGLDSLTAQLFRSTLEKGQVYLSLGYAFVGPARAADAGIGELTGTSALVEELKKALSSSGPSDSVAADSVRLHVVRAGAVEIGLDAQRFPDLMRRVELNDRAPPGYAALDVYCYDFNNDVRPDLAEKEVEFDAEGVTGKRIQRSAWFTSNQPDLYAASVRFPVAVRIDRPYRYRIHEVKKNGMEHAGPWRESVSWSRILDVTSPPKEAGVRSILGP